jgi:hypothetical protein
MCHRDEKNLQRPDANDSRAGRAEVRVASSMSKVYLVCSVLMAFCISMFGLGCDSPKPAPKMGETKMEGVAPPVVKPDAKKTGKKPKSSGVGSTTGGGVEVPPAGGTPEVTPEVKPEAVPEVKPEATPEVKPEATPEAKPEESTEAKPEEKKAE